MASPISAQGLSKQTHFEATIAGLTHHDVLRVDATESLSTPYKVDLWVRLKYDQLIPDDIVGKKAGLAILLPKKAGEKPSDKRHFFHGLVAEAQESEQPLEKDYRLVHLVLRPQWWFLRLTKDSRTFQEETPLDIIKKLLKEHKIDFQDKTKGAGKTKRSYCVQYQESAFHFLSRLMEEEGIGYCFQQEEKKHTLLLFDEKVPLKFKDKLAFHNATSSQGHDRDHLWRFHRVFDATSSSLALNDYFSEKPGDKLHNKQPGQAKHGLKLDVYEHPGFYSKLSDGEKAAKRRIEEAEWVAAQVTGRTTYLGLTAGQNIAVEKCLDKKLNGDYMITEMTHHYGISLGGDKAEAYQNFFKAIPKKTVFRPTRVHKRPRIDGVQTAVVTGPKGDEIHTDKGGRVKIKFYWDTYSEEDEKSSPFFRVITPWSGKGWGAFSVPRIGQEVMVQFEEGDPERPIIVGCVYNGENKPPYDVKDKTQTILKTQSTPKGTKENYNELRITDAKDKEEIYFQAEKDYKTLVKNARDTTIQKSHDTLTLEEGNRTVLLKKGSLDTTLDEGDEKRTLKKGSQTLVIDAGDQKITVSKGDQTIKVEKGKRSVTIKQDDKLDISGGWTISVKGKMKVDAKGGIAFKTPGTFEVSCTNFKVKANASAEVKANATMGLQANATNDVKGSAMVNVKGGLINLN